MAPDLIDRLPTRQAARLPIASATGHEPSCPRDSVGQEMAAAPDATEVGHRLRALRESLSLTRAEMADANSIDRTNYGRFEDGKRLITIDIAFRLKVRYGITLEWLYAGEMGSLPMAVAERIRNRS